MLRAHSAVFCHLAPGDLAWGLGDRGMGGVLEEAQKTGTATGTGGEGEVFL